MMKSRSFTIVNVPDPKNLKATFTYNFFVKDERVNDSGDPKVAGFDNKNLKNILNEGVLDASVPRYVLVNFDEVPLGESDVTLQEIIQKNLISKMCSEETITNVGFTALRETDEKSTGRLRQKIDAVSKINNFSFSDTNQSKKIAEKLGVSHQDIQEIISPIKDPSTFIVNGVVPLSTTPSVFEKSSMAKLQSQVNNRLMHIAINGADDASPLSNIQTIKIVKKISEDFLSTAKSNAMLSTDVNPIIISFKQPKKTSYLSTPTILKQSVVGYIVVRHQFFDDGTKGSRSFVLPGAKNTNFIDTEILYGSTYSYEARSIVIVDAIVSGYIKQSTGKATESLDNWILSFLVVSRPSNASKVRTEEYQPPNAPEGIFYRYNYVKSSGLMITWQMPTGRSRDVKYYQIFRRKTIFEPFKCIAQIDFDDSLVKTVLKETVSPERIIKYGGPYNFYEDMDFSRDSSYIYAICAVDAHGYTSGYSSQTQVSFDKLKNAISLKVISRQDAPKSYPNFYVNPTISDSITSDSFTQDAIYDSRRKKMTVYFTPDALSTKTLSGDKSDVLVTTVDKPAYNFHIINLDVQKSATASFLVRDLRNNKL